MTTQTAAMLEHFAGREWGDAIQSLGEADFARTVLRAMGAVIPVDHLAVVAFDGELAAQLAAAASRQPGGIAMEAGKLYERARFYLHDPGAKLLGTGGPPGPMLLRLRVGDVTDRRYREQIYDRYGLIERLSVIGQVRDRWLMLNLYRSRGSERFSERDVRRLRDLAEPLLALAGKHVSLVRRDAKPRSYPESIAYLDGVLAALDARLTPRERAVCSRALVGQTVRGVATDLGIRPPTVATLRRRAYAKLGISSINELFTRCLDQLARGGTRR